MSLGVVCGRPAASSHRSTSSFLIAIPLASSRLRPRTNDARPRRVHTAAVDKGQGLQSRQSPHRPMLNDLERGVFLLFPWPKQPRSARRTGSSTVPETSYIIGALPTHLFTMPVDTPLGRVSGVSIIACVVAIGSAFIAWFVETHLLGPYRLRDHPGD